MITRYWPCMTSPRTVSSASIAGVGDRDLDEDDVGVGREVVIAAQPAHLVGVLVGAPFAGGVRDEPDRAAGESRTKIWLVSSRCVVVTRSSNARTRDTSETPMIAAMKQAAILMPSGRSTTLLTVV